MTRRAAGAPAGSAPDGAAPDGAAPDGATASHGAAPHGATVDRLAGALRRRVLDGELGPGTRLVERELLAVHGAARHTLRAALRLLAAEGLVELVPNRGARVAVPDPERLADLFALRTALEVEAARLALARDPTGLTATLAAAAGRLRTVCTAPTSAWSAVADAHADVHRAIVAAADAPRIAAAHDALEAEMRLFLLALAPVWTLDRMADHHDALAVGLAAEGPALLRAHLADGLAAVLAGPGGAPAASAGASRTTDG